jgi:ubiquinone/menaquinone biosynthesis C-methylase UbiE
MDWTGLAASTWDDLHSERSADHDFYLGLIKSNPGKVLDVGCATGRLLVPYLAEGIDIEGMDSSSDMLALCGQKIERLGLETALYQGSMQTLDPPSVYTTIIVPGGSFQLVADRDEAAETLLRFHSHLEPSGVVAISLDDAWAELTDYNPGQRIRSERVQLSDGTELLHDRMLISLSRAEQMSTTRLRYRVVENGQVISEETFDMTMRCYFKHEMELMLRIAGFQDVEWSEFICTARK